MLRLSRFAELCQERQKKEEAAIQVPRVCRQQFISCEKLKKASSCANTFSED